MLGKRGEKGGGSGEGAGLGRREESSETSGRGAMRGESGCGGSTCGLY